MMPTYVLLWTWTDQGAKTAKETVKRHDVIVPEFQKLGVTVKETYWTMGMYDGLAILDAPDEATMSKASLWLATKGNVRTVTARAYTKSEFSKIVEGLP